jgi:hypothetical protein
LPSPLPINESVPLAPSKPQQLSSYIQRKPILIRLERNRIDRDHPNYHYREHAANTAVLPSTTGNDPIIEDIEETVTESKALGSSHDGASSNTSSYIQRKPILIRLERNRIDRDHPNYHYRQHAANTAVLPSITGNDLIIENIEETVTESKALGSSHDLDSRPNWRPTRLRTDHHQPNPRLHRNQRRSWLQRRRRVNCTTSNTWDLGILNAGMGWG